jgi:type II pantothenate kinase
MIVGIDIGSTITKAVSVEQGRVVLKVKTRAADPISSGMGAFGKLVLENHIKISEIERINMTGVGAARIKGDVYGIPTHIIEEFTAVGVGGMFQTGSDNIVIANIGTGTSLVRATRGAISHMGGSGVGGGTILGLGKQLLGLSNFDDILDAARDGDLHQVDLFISDIGDQNIGMLGMETTAANFGKMLDTASKADIAAAILNMVYQTIGMVSVFAARGEGLSLVTVTGSGSLNPIGKKVLASIGGLSNITFEHPKDAQYTTAIGAALAK